MRMRGWNSSFEASLSLLVMVARASLAWFSFPIQSATSLQWSGVWRGDRFSNAALRYSSSAASASKLAYASVTEN